MNSLRHRSIPSPLGTLLLVADGADQLCGLYLPDHTDGHAAPARQNAGSVIDQAAAQLDEYFSGDDRVRAAARDRG